MEVAPRGWMDDMDMAQMENVVQAMNLDKSSNNVAELMNFDAYQMNPSFNWLNFSDPYDLGIPLVDGDIMGSSTYHGENQLPFPMDYVDHEANLIRTRDKSHECHVIPRPPMPPLAERMLRAMYLLKESSTEETLAQIWAPVKSGSDYFLSTREQPYLSDHQLSGYRKVSELFTFSVKPKLGSFLGLPGRVFTSGAPEWTSNVMYYNKTEYMRMKHAADHEVRGSIALPIFEDDSLERSCCAVLEVVTKKEKCNFDLEMKNICRALEAVNLRTKMPPKLYPQALSRNQKAVLAEIKDVLRVICQTHHLPLALTWIPCSYIEGADDETMSVCSRGYNARLNEKCVLCIEDNACYVNDKDMESFVHACAENYLEEEQGIVGKALHSNQPFFNPDVKEYHVSDYPLVHHARKFGLNAAIAMRIRSTYTVNNDYILEIFLPINMKTSEEHRLLLSSLSITMQRINKSLRIVSDTELLKTEDSKIEFLDISRSFERPLIDGETNCVDGLMGNAYKVTKGYCPRGKPTAGLKKQMEKKRSTAEKHVSLSVLQNYFSGSLKITSRGAFKITSRLPYYSQKDMQTTRHPEVAVSQDKQASNPLDPALAADKDGRVEHSRPTSSGMTDSTSGSGTASMMKGSSLSSIKRHDSSNVSVKATYKEDSIRFKFEVGGGCFRLYEEVALRFNLQTWQFQLRYVDDEDEWVMLLSDSDLLKCLEVFDFMGKRSVRIMVRDIPCASGGSSGSTSC